jgi:hypothetical protein
VKSKQGVKTVLCMCVCALICCGIIFSLNRARLLSYKSRGTRPNRSRQTVYLQLFDPNKKSHIDCLNEGISHSTLLSRCHAHSCERSGSGEQRERRPAGRKSEDELGNGEVKQNKRQIVLSKTGQRSEQTGEQRCDKMVRSFGIWKLRRESWGCK